jgi:hypothetical protein
MTASILGVSVETVAPVQNARTPATAISAAGVNDAGALARQQLPSAVPAVTALAAYAAYVPQPTKPAAPRSPSAPTSGALAAQFIGQAAITREEDLAIFAPRVTAPATPDETAPDDYLTALRIARGEVTAPQAAAAKPVSPATPSLPTATQTLPQTVTPSAVPTSDAVARSVVAQAAFGLPALFTQFIRKPTIVSARGLTAYQVAQERNAALRPAAQQAAPVT